MASHFNAYETLKGTIQAYTVQLIQLWAQSQIRPSRNIVATLNQRVKVIQSLMEQLTPVDYRAFYNELPHGMRPLFTVPRRLRNNLPGRNYSYENLNELRRISPETYNWLTKRYNNSNK